MGLSSLSNYGTAALNGVINTGRTAISFGGRTFSATYSGIAASTIPAVNKLASGSFGLLKGAGSVASAHPFVSVVVLLAGAGAVYKFSEEIKNAFTWANNKRTETVAKVWDAFKGPSPALVAAKAAARGKVEKAESEYQEASTALDKAEKELDLVEQRCISARWMDGGDKDKEAAIKSTKAEAELARANLSKAESNARAKKQALEIARKEAENLAADAS